MKLETLILKLAILLVAFAVLSFSILVIPTESNIQEAGIYLPLLLTIYISIIPFLFALFHTFKLLMHIDKDKTFSELSFKALKDIKYSAITFGVLYAIELPLLYRLAQEDDAPGVLALGLIFTFTPIVIAIFTSLLQKIVKKGMNIKS